jgi:hypothetical protein
MGNLLIYSAAAHSCTWPRALQHQGALVVPAVRVFGRLIVVCPHCGELHYHGPDGGPPRLGSGDGFRVPDCKDPTHYAIREVTAGEYVRRGLAAAGFSPMQAREMLTAVARACLVKKAPWDAMSSVAVRPHAGNPDHLKDRPEPA